MSVSLTLLSAHGTDKNLLGCSGKVEEAGVQMYYISEE